MVDIFERGYSCFHCLKEKRRKKGVKRERCIFDFMKEFLSYLSVGIVVGLVGTLISLLCGSNKLAIAYSIGAALSIAMTPLWKRIFLDNGEIKQAPEPAPRKSKAE